MFLKPTMVLKAVTFLMLSALLQPASAFQIKRVGGGSGTVLSLHGDVRDGDYGRLKSILQNGSIVGLEIRSDGGSLEDGFDIARIVRDKGLIVYASKECDSACALIFLAAKESTWTEVAKSACIPFPTPAGKKTMRVPALPSRYRDFWSDSGCRMLLSARSSRHLQARSPF